MKKFSGFTLIELMVAMAIVSILATVGLYAYSSYIKKSRDTKRLQVAQKIETTVTSLIGPPGGIPPTRAALQSTLTNDFGGFKDPTEGKDVCLDTAGTPNQPCRFDYIVYDDGTYSISYGIESKDSTKINFYQTSPTTSPVIPFTKIGVYRGTAPFIGAAVDGNYIPQQPLGGAFVPTNVSAPITSLTNDRLDVVSSPTSGCSPACVSPETCDVNVCKCGTSPSCIPLGKTCGSTTFGLMCGSTLGGGGLGGL